MKTQSLSPRWAGQAGLRTAFTLPELMISLTLFLLLASGIICAHLFGLRMSLLTEAKLTASDAARRAMGQMADEIRQCASTYVGNVTNGVFVAHLDGEPQTGSGLLIRATTNTSKFVLYFLNPGDQSFRRTTSAPNTTTILARDVTNQTVFVAQDCLGQVLTNSQNNRVIQVTLDFFQPQPQLPTPDYYRLQTAVTRRAL